MNPAIENLKSIKQALQSMKDLLMQRKPDKILEHSSLIEKMIAPLRDSMAVIDGMEETEKTEAKSLLSDIKKISRTNNAVASAFNMLIKSTLSSITDRPADKHTYGKDQSKDAPAAPLLVYEQG